MHFHLADRYQPGSSWVHRLDPRAKILIVTGFILGLSLSSPGAWLPFLAYFALLLLAAAASRLGPGFAVRRSFVALPFRHCHS